MCSFAINVGYCEYNHHTNAFLRAMIRLRPSYTVQQSGSMGGKAREAQINKQLMMENIVGDEFPPLYD